MVSKRLYALRGIREMVGIVILVLSFAVSCIDSESTGKDVEVITQDMNDSKEEIVSDAAIEYAQYDVFVSEVVPNEDQRLVSLREGDYWAHLPLESARISMWEIFTYDVEHNGYVASFDLVIPITDSIRSSFVGYPRFYFIDKKIMIDYSERISPNMRMPIFKTGDFYVSTYNEKSKLDNMIIYSSDLIDWYQSGVIHPGAPILLYEQDEKLFALAGRQVWDVSDPRHTRLSRELKYTVMPPELPITSWSPYVAFIDYCFNINNHLVMYTGIAAEEQSGGAYFQVINLDDFSEKSLKVGNGLPGVYNYKAVEREDGWKIYHIGFDPADGIIVLDPFAPDGPAIIERLPGVNLPGSAQQ